MKPQLRIVRPWDAAVHDSVWRAQQADAARRRKLALLVLACVSVAILALVLL